MFTRLFCQSCSYLNLTCWMGLVDLWRFKWYRQVLFDFLWPCPPVISTVYLWFFQGFIEILFVMFQVSSRTLSYRYLFPLCRNYILQRGNYDFPCVPLLLHSLRVLEMSPSFGPNCIWWKHFKQSYHHVAIRSCLIFRIHALLEST